MEKTIVVIGFGQLPNSVLTPVIRRPRPTLNCPRSGFKAQTKGWRRYRTGIGNTGVNRGDKTGVRLSHRIGLTSSEKQKGNRYTAFH
jgi:hypothetical protein